MKLSMPRLKLSWVMLAVPALIVTGASLWALVSVTLEVAAGSQPGDLFFPIREQALELQLSLASDPQERTEIELRLSETPRADALAPAALGDEPIESTAGSPTQAMTEVRSIEPSEATTMVATSDVSETPAPADPTETPSKDPGSNRGPSASNTPEPTRTTKPADVIEATHTHEPTKTAEPTRTLEPTRTDEPTRTPESTRTQEPSKTPSDNSGSGSGGSGIGPTETPRPEDMTVQGTLEATGGVWVVSGQSFQVTGATEIRGDPQIGGSIEVRAWRYWDGSVVAYRIEEK